MATYEKRNNGAWRVRVRRQGKDLSATFSTKAEAKAWAEQPEGVSKSARQHIVTPQGSPEPTPAPVTTPSGPTLKSLIERYVDGCTPTKRGATKEASKLRMILTHPIADILVSQLNASHIAQYRDARLTGRHGSKKPDGTIQAVGKMTVRRELDALSSVFTTAHDEWDMEWLQNPVRKIIKKLPGPDSNRRERRLEPEEFERLIKAAAAYGDGTMLRTILFAVETCMRRGEIARLQWKQVDLKKRLVRLARTHTKNGKPRTVPLSTLALEILAKQEQMGKQAETASPDPEALVFGMQPDSMTQAFDRICERAEIEDLTLHDMRHEGTTRLFEQRKLNPIEAMLVTGHSDLRMLMRYTHPKAEDLIQRGLFD